MSQLQSAKNTRLRLSKLSNQNELSSFPALILALNKHLLKLVAKSFVVVLKKSFFLRMLVEKSSLFSTNCLPRLSSQLLSIQSEMLSVLLSFFSLLKISFSAALFETTLPLLFSLALFQKLS